jgi:hypothetical protein
VALIYNPNTQKAKTLKDSLCYIEEPCQEKKEEEEEGEG